MPSLEPTAEREATTFETVGRLAYDALLYCLREVRSTAHAVDEGFASRTGARRILRNVTEVGMIAAIALAKRPARAAAAVALAMAIPHAYLTWRGLKAGALLASEQLEEELHAAKEGMGK